MSIPSARPLPADSHVQPERHWGRLLWTAGLLAALAVIWLMTGWDLFYAAIVAVASTADLPQRPVTRPRAVRNLLVTAGLVMVGAALFGRDMPERLVQGFVGLAIGGLVWLGAALRQRRS